MGYHRLFHPVFHAIVQFCFEQFAPSLVSYLSLRPCIQTTQHSLSFQSSAQRTFSHIAFCNSRSYCVRTANRTILMKQKETSGIIRRHKNASMQHRWILISRWNSSGATLQSMNTTMHQTRPREHTNGVHLASVAEKVDFFSA
jgi:hypothetical protein